MLALVALVGNIANAELLKNFKYDGKIEVNAYNQNNADFNKDLNDKSGAVDTRLMLNAGFDLNEDVDAVVTAVKNNRKYGQAAETATSDNVATTTGILDVVTFEQAYLNLKGVLGLDHKLGRQFYGEAGDMVVYYGPQMWPYTSPMAVTAIDGWTGWHKLTGLGRDWDMHAIIAKEVRGNGNTDINLSGFNAKTSVADVNLNGYVYQKNDNNTSAGNNDYLTLVGIRAKYEIPQVKNLVVAAEYDMNMGKNTNAADKHEGFAYKLNADYSMDLAGKLAFSGEYVHQTGDDDAADSKDEAYQDINSDYRPGIIMGGGFATGAAFGANDGVTTYNLGAMWTPAKMEKLTLAAKYYNFSADNKNTFAGDEHVGNELDLCAKWQHSENVAVKGYYAMFMPEKDNFANDDSQTMMGAAFMVKF
ncbi:MAG TPA: hypothetical protein DCQ25_06835 [Elusimicrobia bacterium]|nr:hypothetical protein [Elusimicrobiota bacterium]